MVPLWKFFWMILRGVRQGVYPLSPLLYVLWVEVLANLIRRSSEISRFQFPGASGKQARVRLYADDTICVIKDVRSRTKLFKYVNVYEFGSGAKLNRSMPKLKPCGLGPECRVRTKPLGLKWVRKMKVLGVLVSGEEDNLQPKIDQLEKSLNLSRSRSLPLPGKALIITPLPVINAKYSFICVDRCFNQITVHSLPSY